MYDVIIIGCGPVGALAANLLGKAGLSVLVLERETELHPLPRAVHLDHEMMRLFQSAGVIDAVLPLMRDTDGHLHIGADHGVIRYMGTVGKPRPFGWSNDYFFYQPELEATLRDGFAVYRHVEMRLGAAFERLEQSDAGVTVIYAQGGIPAQAQTRWVIACDGSRSAVRKALGIALEDLDFEEPWLVVDAEVDGPVAFPVLTGVPEEADLQRLSVMMCDPQRPTTIVPGRGNHRRWEFMLLPGEDDAIMMQPAQVAKLVRPYLGNVQHRIVRASTYRFHGLVAAQWQAGAVFLAGDAAHQTPPFFGQGMCHGFRDVANLAWKMAAIVQDGADPAILDTYQPERDAHVRSVIGAAVGAGRYICELDPAKAAVRDAQFRAAAKQAAPETAADLIPAIQTGIVLTGTSGAGERFIQSRIGDRLLDDVTGGGWRLFVHGAPVQHDPSDVTIAYCDDLADAGAVRDWLTTRGVKSVLVRPDHYVFGTAQDNGISLLNARCAALGLTQNIHMEIA